MDCSLYKKVFYPERMAIIGASDNMTKFGGLFLDAQHALGYQGEIFPVNPKAESIQGRKAFKKMSEILSDVDLAVIAVPAPMVTESIRECVAKKVKAVQILSAGFKEKDAAGLKIEREIVELTRQNDIKLIGPNCFGIYSPRVRLTLIPGLEFPIEEGNVGLFSQSGGGACDIVYSAMGRGVRFSLVVSYGNAAGINAEEMLEYFAEDPNTQIVAGYVEGIEDGNRFMRALRNCAAKKPVVILKSGLSEQGIRGTIGHTGSMAGTKQAWDAAIRGAGAVAAENMKDLTECLMAFSCLENFKGRNAGIMAGGGARVVEGLDAASEHGFNVPEVDENTTEELAALLPMEGSKAANPVDLANPILTSEFLNPIAESLASSDQIDFLVIYQMLFYPAVIQRRMRRFLGDKAPTFEYFEQISSKVNEIRSKAGKPTVMVLVDVGSHPDHSTIEADRLKARKYYTDQLIPCFDSGFSAFSVLKRISDYYMRRDCVLTESQSF